MTLFVRMARLFGLHAMAPLGSLAVLVSPLPILTAKPAVSGFSFLDRALSSAFSHAPSSSILLVSEGE